MARPRVLADRYQIESVLGKGGMAEVYLGIDRVLGRRVAVKVLAKGFAEDDSFVARFRREAQAAASLNHPNVVGVFDTGSDDGTHFIVMEYVQGRTLAEVVREDAPLLPERAVEIVEAVAGGVAIAHAQGIIHRDIKPANIMLTPSGDVKVMDFGIARATSTDSLTQTATVLGTATYFSPEQAQGARVDARSDIYSLGCVLYEMLTAQPPFAGDTPVAVAYKHVREDPVPPSRLNPDVPSDLDAIVLKSLAKNPDNRYQTAEELRTDLHRFRQGQPVAATPVISMGETALFERPAGTAVLPATTTEQVERPRRWIAVAVLVGLLAVVAVGLFFLARSILGGPTLLRVPDVVGMDRRAAELRLEQAGFNSGVAGREFSDRFERGQVIDYNPKRASEGATINLIISNGPEILTVEVPDVICEPLNQALDELRGAGLVPDIAGEESNSDCNPGEVSQTNPGPGDEVEEGTTVFVFTHPEPPPTAPPTTPSPTPTETVSPSPTATPTESPGGGDGGDGEGEG